MAAQNTVREDGIAYILTYLLTFLSGIAVYFTLGQKVPQLKFHAVQAIFFGIALLIVAGILHLVSSGIIGSIVGFVGWLYGLYVGWQGSIGNDIEIPVIGKYARGYSK